MVDTEVVEMIDMGDLEYYLSSGDKS